MPSDSSRAASTRARNGAVDQVSGCHPHAAVHDRMLRPAPLRLRAHAPTHGTPDRHDAPTARHRRRPPWSRSCRGASLSRRRSPSATTVPLATVGRQRSAASFAALRDRGARDPAADAAGVRGRRRRPRARGHVEPRRRASRRSTPCGDGSTAASRGAEVTGRPRRRRRPSSSPTISATLVDASTRRREGFDAVASLPIAEGVAQPRTTAKQLRPRSKTARRQRSPTTLEARRGHRRRRGDLARPDERRRPRSTPSRPAPAAERSAP